MRRCFVCGADAATTLRKRLATRKFGVCAQHLPWLTEEQEKRQARRMPRTDRAEPNYLGVDVKALGGHRLPSEHSLLGTMLKTEREWADRYGWEFQPLQLLGSKPEAPDPDPSDAAG